MDDTFGQKNKNRKKSLFDAGPTNGYFITSLPWTCVEGTRTTY